MTTDPKHTHKIIVRPGRLSLYQQIQVDRVVVSKDGPATVFCNGTLFKIAPGNTLILRKTKLEALN